MESLKSDQKLQTLFRVLQIDAEQQEKLFSLVYEHLINSSSCVMHLKKIENDVMKLAMIESFSGEVQDILHEIIYSLKQHILIHYSTIERVDTLEGKVDKLIDENKEMRATTNRLIVDIEERKAREQVTDGLILSNEIANLYIEYYVKPVFYRKSGHTSWDRFTSSLAKIEQQIDCKRLESIEKDESPPYETLYKELIEYLEPLQKCISLSLTDIRYLKKDRCQLVQYQSKSVDEQLHLLEKARNFQFPDTFEFKNLVKSMISELEEKKASFHRCT